MKSNVLNSGLLAILPLIILISSCSGVRDGDPKILVFSKTSGFYHASIPDGIAAIEKLGSENGFEVDTTTNADHFTEANLEQYSAVIFLNTTGDVLNEYQEADFERYIQSGGGYVGLHSAADTEYQWGWYGRLAGGYFLDHPGINDPHPNVQPGVLTVGDHTHPSVEFLPENWEHTDEWYSYKNLNENVNVLLSVDEDSYEGGADMGEHPIAWYHDYDGGRAFYTGLGHTNEAYSNDLFLQHILAGIQYAIGENKIPDYSKATTHRVPEANRFTKVSLSTGEFTEPTEMAILPNRDVLIAQRRGEIFLYKNSDSTLSMAGNLDVYWQTDIPGVNAEEGLMGIQTDPDFENNRHIFLFYSPVDTSVNRLSRFSFEEDKIVTDSEKIILELYSQRDICCHTGGSIAFDNDGLLYLSTGDNSTPFNQPDQKYINNGYAPLDENPGFEQYNAMRSSGNANDLRGKILRIRVNEDGSYDIPEGNLYPEGTEGARPEIYVQGNRNPYRISIDQKTGYLYWGEVGPDASNDSLETRGPMGYDELNQAREAGFFGWPMFVGDNYAYHTYNYTTGESGEAFDPQNPVNNSRLNTGIEELPPAQPAFIWYPYGASEEFPAVGTGGRNAMAGPVYYTDMYPDGNKLPEYFDGKLFFYDWIRGWIKIVSMQPNGDFDKMDSFMADTDFNNIIDMEVGPEGRIYLLEYGSGWFSRNDDSALSFIDYNSGNRAPVVEEVIVDKTSGTLPLTVTASVTAGDPEQDELTYRWDLGDGSTMETSVPQIEYTYDEIGEYLISVEVSDAEFSESSRQIAVYAGNAAPIVNILIKGNNTFYFPGTPVEYEITVEDEDGSTEDLSTLFVSADYTEGGDAAEQAQGHQIVTDAMSGKSMIETLDCRACHTLDTESIGPSYLRIAEYYRDSADAVPQLVTKIIEGGSGVWGETMMPAHLDITETDARKMVTWIQSLVQEGEIAESLPQSGSVDPVQGNELTPDGVFILSASYTDQGSAGVKPQTGSSSKYLRNSSVGFSSAGNMEGYSKMTYEGNLLMMVPESQGHFSFDEIDLTGIRSAEIMTASMAPLETNYIFEFRLDSPDGPKIGEAEFAPNAPQSPEGPIFQGLTVDMEPVTDGSTHNLFIVSRPVDEESAGTFILSNIQFKI
ncbi:MAG: ThuA domain-containing protein [Balneolaceae bacterium]